MDLIDRILENWKTSLAALVILIGALAAVYLKYATLTEASGFFVAVIVLLFSKDK